MPKNATIELGTTLEKLLDKLHGWLQDVVIMLPNILLAALLVVLGAAASRWLQRMVEQLLRKLTRNGPISRLSGSVTRMTVLGMTVLWALGLLHLDKTVTSVLAGVGVVGLALGFAFQDIASNFMSGVIMAMYRPFDSGDLVELAGHLCFVQEMTLRATEAETVDGLSIIVPNKEVLQNPIINYTRTRHRRMELAIGTAYCDDLEKVRSVVLSAVDDCPGRDKSREPELFFSEFGDSSINSQLRIWLTESTQVAYLRARSEAMIAIKRAFDREGITIPFPIRTLDFGAGVVGGTRVDQLQLRIAAGGGSAG